MAALAAVVVALALLLQRHPARHVVQLGRVGQVYEDLQEEARCLTGHGQD